jgi:hypothetical protein
MIAEARDRSVNRSGFCYNGFMPEISRFLGIIITMYFSEHPPAHFHVRYGEHKAVISIESLTLLQGKLPPRVYGLVVEWASYHQDELLSNWHLAAAQEPLRPIEPLE